MVDRYMKSSSISLIIGEMQIKTSVRYHPTQVGMAVINKSTNKSVGEDVEKREPLCLLVGMQIGAAIVESSMKFPPKIKDGTAL